jgi:hypothetical protein
LSKLLCDGDIIATPYIDLEVFASEEKDQPRSRSVVDWSNPVAVLILVMDESRRWIRTSIEAAV